MIKTLGLLALVVTGNAFASDSSIKEKKTSMNLYANLVSKTYSDSLKTAQTLKSDINSFLVNPSLMGLEIAKESWRKARAPYGQSEVYRFYNGPIDRDGGPEGLLNSWPLDEVYIDYVVGNPNSGIINDTAKYPIISKELLADLNELDGEKNISTGYHAIEFLLWGQDLYTDSAGRRPYTDYVAGVGQNAQRRADYLKAATDLLVENLEELVVEWAPNQNNFRKEFLNQDADKALKNIFNGIVFMAGDELSGERMYVAYETQGQEDEHSCFSDMTHMDVQWNMWGLESVVNESKLLEIGSLKNSKEAAAVKAQMKDAKAKLAAIPQPFDQALVSEEGRAKILEAVESLEALAADLVKAGKVIGVNIDY